MSIDTGYKFNNPSLLSVALTHTSFSHEHRESKVINNERLEFLGDAVLELVVSNYIFNKFDELTEGEMTKLRASIVCEGSLAKVGKILNIGENLKLGKGEEITGGRKRDSLIADAFEAIIGAIYIDSNNIKEAEKFILNKMSKIITEKRKTFEISDRKTYLQEYIQRTSHIPIKYEILKEEGPAHDKIFTILVTHEGRKLGTGTGKSKKDAEQNAALKAIEFLDKK